MSYQITEWVDGIRCHAHQKAALYAIAENYSANADSSKALTHRKIAKAGGISLRAARNAVRRLVESGIIEPVGSSGIQGTHYRMIWKAGG